MSFTYIVKVIVDNDLQTITFDRGIIDDLESAFELYQGTNYFDTLESSIKFTVYITLGQAGLLNDFPISNEFINENRTWIKDYRVETIFGREMTEVFYEGLQMLRDFFHSLIGEHKKLRINTTEIERHKDYVENLIRYYNEKRNLNSTGVGIESLQYLKAAAIRQVMELEGIRKNEKRPITWRALNDKIYDIVGELRKDPLLDIELPSFLHDVAASQR